MANRLELNWKLEGGVDEQRYYCSETPINIENPPTPKKILSVDVRSYVDTDIDYNQTYFVRVSSVKNGIEKFSDEVEITSQEKIYRVQLNVTSKNELDSYGTLPLTWEDNGIFFSDTNNEIKHTSATSYLKSMENFDWNGSWDIEFDVFIDSTIPNSYKAIVSNRFNSWSDYGGIIIYFNDAVSGGYENQKFGIGNYGADGLMSAVFSRDVWHHVRCIKTTDHKYTMYVNDILQYSDATTNISNRNPSSGVINMGLVSTSISGNGVRIQNFIIR